MEAHVRLIPRDEQFYPMFEELAKRLSAATSLLAQLFAHPERLDELVAEIKRVEHEADTLTHDVIVRIDKSFVTPIDREDIHLLASRLDDVIDLVDGVARRAQMFSVREPRPEAAALAGVLCRAAECLEASVGNLKKPKMVLDATGKLKKLEEEADAIYHEAVGQLFRVEKDPIEVIKWKELFDKLEDAVDLCDDASNVLESIALKNS
jgi:predicted phosphate transport protein (TIGR00153 family)